MRRGRGKGKKQNESAREDRESGEEEKILPAYRRRGRPQMPMKDDFEEEEEEEEDEEMVEKMEEEIDDTNDGSATSKEKKRKIAHGSNAGRNDEESGLGSKSSTDDSLRSTSIGFRQNGSRRKSKPRRAAEAVVECNGVWETS